MTLPVRAQILLTTCNCPVGGKSFVAHSIYIPMRSVGALPRYHELATKTAKQ